MTPTDRAAELVRQLQAAEKWRVHVKSELQRCREYYKDNEAHIVPVRGTGNQGWMATFLANLWNNLVYDEPGDLTHAAAIVAEQGREITELTTCMREAQDSSLELGYQLHRLREAVEAIANDTNGCIQERLRAALTEVPDGK